MEYFTHLGLKNFRLFSERTTFKLAPITLITGTNNSGKSSLIKTVQLFNSSVKETKDLTNLSFAQGKHNLGSFHHAKTKHSDDDTLEFEFDFELPVLDEKGYVSFKYRPANQKSEKGTLISYRVFLENGETLLGGVSKEYDPDRNNYRINIKKLFNLFLNRIDDKFIEYIKELEIELLDPWSDASVIRSYGGIADLNVANQDIFGLFKRGYIRDQIYRNDSLFIDPNEFDNEAYYLKNMDVVDLELREKLDEEIEQLFQKGVSVEFYENEGDDVFSTLGFALDYWTPGIEHSIPEVKEKGWSYMMSYLLNTYIPYLHKSLTEFHHKFYHVDSLSSLRANTSRLYTNASDIVDINALIYEFSQLDIPGDDEILNFITKQLQLFEIGDKIDIQRIQGVATEISIIKNGEKTLLADLGYGYSQFLPIIIKVALISFKKRYFFDQGRSQYNYPPSLLLLEEPESNLHPSYQSKLADFILAAATEFNIQFLVETHSEYMIRKFQFLVATKKIDSDGINIYYFNKPNSAEFMNSPYKKIDILENGRLSEEFGAGFFDETPRLLSDLFNSNFN